MNTLVTYLILFQVMKYLFLKKFVNSLFTGYDKE